MRATPHIEAIHPLTPLQEGILFHSLAAPDAGLYVVQPVFELEGDVDPVLLRRAAEALVERHAALRTAFVWQGQERPRQVVHRHVDTPWQERDLRGQDAGAALAAFLEEDRGRRLDPGRAPLCRFALLRVEDRLRWMVVTHHHLVLDGWSMPILTRELAALYDALRTGGPDGLPPARPFGDYAAWLARRPAAASEAFWRDSLRGFRAPTPLVVDTVARAAESGRPLTGRARAAVEPGAAARLREFGRRRQLAFATLAQAAWALLLSRYSGERDVLFGVVTSGRSADVEGVEGIVGMFVNSLPVRVRVPRRAPVLPWLRDLQAALTALREHEHCSLTQVQAWCELPAGTPLFESLLAVQTLGPISPELRLDGLVVRPLAGEERVGLPLTVVAYPAPGDGVWLGVEYDRRRIPSELAGPLLDHYGRLLAGLVTAEDVDAVEMLCPARPAESVHVLDAELRPLPAGATGDVWLAGDPLPPGWPSAARTAARLRPDPLGTEAGARMLRTGWRARLRPDGELELLAPAEPGATGARPAVSAAEVELLLAGHPAVTRALVRGAEAFVVLVPGERAGDLRAHLRRALPAHLVPASIRVVERLPPPDPEESPPHRESPPPDDLLHRLAQAPAERRARFLERLRSELAPAGDDPPPHPRPAGEPAPPSFQQEQFWVLERLARGETAHNVSLVVELPAPADPAAARAALDGLVERHEVLRCALLESAGGLSLEVAAPAPVTLPVSDLAALPAETREAEAARLATAEARLAFDLARPPLLRARLLVGAGGGRDRLVVVVPHVAIDPGSARILARDLLALEAAARAGGTAVLPPLALQYPDYAWWQRERLERRRESLLAYWRQQLHGWQPLALVSDRPWSPGLGPEGTGAWLQLSPAQAAELERAGSGLEAALLAAYVELLHRWSGQTDVLLGMGVDLRDRPELDGLLGDFGNHVVLRVDAGGRPSLAELARRAARVLAEAREHRDLPFTALVQALQPARDAGRLPLFQVAFSYEQALGTGGDDQAVDGVHSGRIPYEVALICVRTDAGVRIALGANRNLFDPGTVERMAGVLRQLLDAAAADPGRPLTDLPLLPAGQESQLLAWGRGPAAARPAAGLGELFAARAAARPDAVALVHDGRPLTYGELARRAARVAHAVRRRGLGPEDRVAILLERGPDMVAAVLGVLMAGAAYVPLDPAHPAARTAFVVADAGARLTLTRAELDALDGLPEDPPPPLAGPGHLAYVLYTSGSTGQPKGVLVDQGSVAGFATHIAAAYGVDDRGRVLGMAPLTFDLSVFEIFTALLSGASLHLAGERDRLQPDRLQRILRDGHVTVAELPPALMPMLDPNALPDLRLVSVGGEAFPGELVGRWWRPGRRFVNGYGPTETTVAVTLKDCQGSWDRMPPIGRPMPGHSAYVLDGGLRLVPVGVPGELCIGGAGLARGYLGRPDQTAERFVPDPFGEPGARLYRTGDRAYWLPSGELQLLGRVDRQVKVRGHRVELGEVESAIGRLEGVRQVAVEAPLDEAGRPQLVAYLAGGWRPDVSELRARLEAELPGYMLPSRVVHMERLPLTSRGKVDRAALPAPAAGTDGSEAVVAPRTWIEERIAGAVVGPLLQAGAVDVERNFFELGGNSLEAIQVVSRVAEAFAVEIDLGEFLAEPTVRRLGQLVEAAQAAGAEAGDLLRQIVEEVEALSEEEAERVLASLEQRGD